MQHTQDPKIRNFNRKQLKAFFNIFSMSIKTQKDKIVTLEEAQLYSNKATL
jgi:hypothetical protein